MTTANSFSNRTIGRNPPRLVARAIPLIGFLTLFAGCQEQAKSIQYREREVSEPMQKQQTIDSPQQHYINATGGIPSSQRALVADLKQRYGGIDASVTEQPAAQEHLANFARLMREWNPLQFSADDLEAIAGKPTEEVLLPSELHPPNSQQALTYWFYGSGSAGAGWEFTTDSGMIIGVRYIMGQ